MTTARTPGPYEGAQFQAVVEGAGEGVDARRERRPAQSAQQREDRVGAGGQDQPVVADERAVRALDRPRRPVDPHRPRPEPYRLQGPGQGDHLGGVPSGEDVGEQHPVVGGVRFLAEEGDGQALGEPGARRSAPDHHDPCTHTGRVRGRCFPSASRLFPYGTLISVRGAERCEARPG
ncbi:hypothetical protein STANM309S_02093 [Streptomyces tanashiensis]